MRTETSDKPDLWLVDIGRLVRVRAPNGCDALSLARLDAGAVTSGPVLYRMQQGNILEVLHGENHDAADRS